MTSGFKRFGARQARGESVARAAPASLAVQVAFAALALGLLVYVLARPPGSAYLLPAWLGMSGALPPAAAAAALGAQLPSFVHTLAFGLLTYACLAPTRRAALASAGVWLAVNTLFEIGQAPEAARWIAAHTPAWFGSVPVLANVPAYFLAGRFDWLDLAAVAAGAASAVFVAGISRRKDIP